MPPLRRTAALEPLARRGRSPALVVAVSQVIELSKNQRTFGVRLHYRASSTPMRARFLATPRADWSVQEVRLDGRRAAIDDGVVVLQCGGVFTTKARRHGGTEEKKQRRECRGN